MRLDIKITATPDIIDKIYFYANTIEKGRAKIPINVLNPMQF